MEMKLGSRELGECTLLLWLQIRKKPKTPSTRADFPAIVRSTVKQYLLWYSSWCLWVHLILRGRELRVRRIPPGKPGFPAPDQVALSRFPDMELVLSWVNHPFCWNLSISFCQEQTLFSLTAVASVMPVLCLSAICEGCSLEEQNITYMQSVLH